MFIILLRSLYLIVLLSSMFIITYFPIYYSLCSLTILVIDPSLVYRYWIIAIIAHMLITFRSLIAIPIARSFISS